MRTLWILGLLLSHVGYINNANCRNRATQIIQKAEQHLRGKSTQALMTMTIKRPEFTRKLKLRSWTVGQQRALVEILTPPKEEGVASLRVKNNMWNYLPKVDQVVRVPTSLMLQSWMGSDFNNDDLMKASSLARDYTHRIVKQQKLNGQKTLLIECNPKPDAPVVWGKVLYWARTKDHLPIRQKFLDEDGRWVRTISYSKFKKMDDRIVPSVVRVQTAETPKNSTIVQYKRLLYDRKIDLGIFNKEHLRQNAQKGTFISAGWSMAPMRRGKTRKRRR